MKTKLEARLKELKEEYEKGQERLAVLNQETDLLRNTMLRIGGAIQVITEMLEEAPVTTFKPTTNGVELSENPK